MIKGAVLSECLKYRYHLWREWDPRRPRVVFLLLNPSTAEASIEDTTSKKAATFARRWGMGRLDILNVYAYRTKDPNILKAAEKVGINVIGPENEAFWKAVLPQAQVVVAAWGANPTPDRVTWAVSAASSVGVKLSALRTISNGGPEHILYLPGGLVPQPFTP